MGGLGYARRDETAENSPGGAAEFSWFKPPVDPGFFLCLLGMALLSSPGCCSGGGKRIRPGGARVLGDGYQNRQKPAPTGASPGEGAGPFSLEKGRRPNNILVK